MKSFKVALLALSMALLLQGCDDDDSDSTFNPPPTSADIDTNIVGFWSESSSSDSLSAISFMADGTYVQAQVNNNSLVDDSNGGLEWGEYSIDKDTGKLTTTQLFDENGEMGLSGDMNYFARVVNGNLVIEADDNDNGSISSDEQFAFAKIQPSGIVGAWDFDDTAENELIGIAFLDDSHYVYVQVDSERLLDDPENGLEWGTYAINPTTKQLTTSQIFDSNGGAGLSEPRTRYASLTNEDTTLTIDVDDNQDGMIGNNESFVFSRGATGSVTDPQMLSGLWRMDLGDEELVTLSFLNDGTYVQTQVTGSTASRDADNGIEWGKYSLKANNELKIDDIVFDNNSIFGLSDDLLRTVEISDDMLTLGVDENDNDIIENNERYTFSKAKSENELGIWKARSGQVDDELILFGLLDDQTFFHVEVDEQAPIDPWDPAPSGLEWNNYTFASNGLFTLGQSLYSGTGDDLSFFYQMDIEVVGDTLTFTGYQNQSEVNNDDGETVIFDRQ